MFNSTQVTPRIFWCQTMISGSMKIELIKEICVQAVISDGCLDKHSNRAQTGVQCSAQVQDLDPTGSKNF